MAFLVLTVIATVCWFVQIALGLSCTLSGYCSLSVVTPYMGPLHTSEGLRQALRNRSYKKEIILEASSVRRAANALTSFRSLERLGMGHHLLIVEKPTVCSHLIMKIPGCGWYNTSFSRSKEQGMYPMKKMQFLRYQTLARAIRLGYNVLLVDTDTVFMHDPYIFFKAPPFSNFTVMNQEEGGRWGTNSGITYVQNAAPDGVVAYIFAEILNRFFRLSENQCKWRISKGFVDGVGDDQDTYMDILKSTFLGKLLGAMIGFIADTSPRHKATMAYLAGLHQLFDPHDLAYEVPAAWQPIVGTKTSSVRCAVLLLRSVMFWHKVLGENPSTAAMYWPPSVTKMLVRWLELKFPLWKRGLPPKELGLWPMYPQNQGDWSREFWEVYLADCPSCPLFPDPLKASDSSRAEAVPDDKIAWFPYWLAGTWGVRGMLGYWDNRTRSPDPPGGVIGHMHSPITECGPQEPAKLMIFCLYGFCDFDLKHKIFHNHMYYALSSAVPRVDVVALSPTVDLSNLRTIDEAWWVFYGLAQVAYALGRAVAWPDLPCSTAWVQDQYQGHEAIPLQIRRGFLAHGPLDKLRCSWDLWWFGGCMEHGRGLYSAEFEHLLSKLPQEQAMPNANNTVLQVGAELAQAVDAQAADLSSRAVPCRNLAPGVEPRDGPSAADRMVSVSVRALRRVVEPLASAPVLYLAAPLRVTFDPDSEQTFREHWNECPPMDRGSEDFQACGLFHELAGDHKLHEDVLQVSAAWREEGGRKEVVLVPKPQPAQP